MLEAVGNMQKVRRLSTLAVVALMTVALVGCGGNSTPSTASARPSAQAAAATPSMSAKMICEQEAAEEVASVIGIKTTKPVVPTWSHGLYSCRYVYANGDIALSVKELANQTATDAYFASLRRLLGERQPWANLGQAAFVTPNGSMVVRKDYKVLFVDISRLPARFGAPPTPRSNAALNVAITIMGCWTGAVSQPFAIRIAGSSNASVAGRRGRASPHRSPDPAHVDKRRAAAMYLPEARPGSPLSYDAPVVVARLRGF